MAKLPAEILEDEHKLIIRVVDALKVFAENMEDGWEVDEETLVDIIEFMRVFAQKWHHAKEEDALFPALVKRGVPRVGCPLVQLKNEHEKSNNYVAELVQSMELYRRSGVEGWTDVIQGLKNLYLYYPNHIWKEENMLFPLTNRLLLPEDQQQLLAEFERIDELHGQKLHDRLEQFALRLEKQTFGD